jgi:hypothetical protein
VPGHFQNRFELIVKKAAALFCVFPLAIAFAVGDYRSEVVRPGSHPRHVDVQDREVLIISNFTQDGGSNRATVVVGAATPTPTPTTTPTPTCSPSPCSPTPTPTSTPTPTATPTPKPTPIPRVVLTATLIGASPTPEFIKPIKIDGPVRLTILPGDGTAFITFNKEGHATSAPTSTP